MRCFLVFLSALFFLQSFSQSTNPAPSSKAKSSNTTGCRKNSSLYWFDTKYHPIYYTEKLGRHPQFPFLQEINGITTSAFFVESINSADNQKKYAREFKAFDLLLRNSGFAHGYKDLTEATVENTFVPRKTIGNLGFYDKVKDRIDYIYVRLNPAGEPAQGVAAWRLTNANGCSLFILHTCGNAFYPQPETGVSTDRRESSDKNPGAGPADLPVSAGGGGCCKTITVENNMAPVDLKNDTVDRPIYIRVNFYQGRIVSSKGKQDTVISLLYHIDTTQSFKDITGKKLKIFASSQSDKLVICRDTVLKYYTHIFVPDTLKSGRLEAVRFVISDTTYTTKKDENKESDCNNKWAIAVDGGISFNSIPRFNNPAAHTQTDGSHFAGTFAISRIFKPWFQLGVSATYMTLSYQDDVAYAGSVAGTYNTITAGKPIIPIQLFGQFNIGKQIGWQANVNFSAGYAVVSGGGITNSGTTLTTKPDMKGGFTAGYKMGLNYFFTCKFGLGFAFSGQYFAANSAVSSYHPIALPVTGGLRFRF
ncbi:MAG: hypothetical protein P4L51_16940 [Puia sp.]|nr:hypothetical protein [Puia sp.]